MDVIPKFVQWSREGEAGKRKLAQVTRYGTIILGFIQGLGLSIGFNNMYSMNLIEDPNWGTYLFIATVLTAGTAFLMWLGEQITEKGIGNGISIIIFAGIVAGFPTAANQMYTMWFTGDNINYFLEITKVVLVAIIFVAITVGVIYMLSGVRKIPVQYAKRMVGRKMYGGQSTHIPLKINSAGVIPVIFASSLLLFPVTIANFFRPGTIADWIATNMTYTAPLGMLFYVILIIGFTYFYTFAQMNPMQMAENMKNNGGYVPGIRPGKATAVYFTRILNRLTLTGSLFLAAISVVPLLLPLIFGEGIKEPIRNTTSISKVNNILLRMSATFIILDNEANIKSPRFFHQQLQFSLQQLEKTYSLALLVSSLAHHFLKL